MSHEALMARAGLLSHDGLVATVDVHAFMYLKTPHKHTKLN